MRTLWTALLLVTTTVPAGHTAEDDATPTVRCTGQPDKTRPIAAPRKGRLTLCAIDLGSNTAKLEVVSMDPGKPLSFKGERQCRARLGFGAKVFDPATGERKSLPAPETATLVDVIQEFQAICARDKGELLGAEATQWARDATNIEDVRTAVQKGTGLDVEVLTPEWEGHFGYVAATRNTPGRFALDPGSNSFQVAWWPKGAKVARTVSVPLGFVRGAHLFYPAEATLTFEEARAKHAAEIRKRLDEALSTLKPASSLAQLKAEVAKGALAPELFVMGQDSALHLATRGALRDPKGGWVTSGEAYEAAVRAGALEPHDKYGEVLAVITAEEISAFLGGLARSAEFDALRRGPARELYGEKALANAVLLDVLARELGVKTIVVAPHEMPAGYILFKLAMGA